MAAGVGCAGARDRCDIPVGHSGGTDGPQEVPRRRLHLSGGRLL